MRMLGAMVLAVFAIAPVAADEPTVHFSVHTDRTLYALNDSVTWEVRLWCSVGDHAGVALVGVNLFDQQGELILPADTETVVDPDDQLQATEFGVAEKFVPLSAGIPGTDDGGGGLLADVSVFQLPDDRLLNVAVDGASHVLARGSFPASELGMNTLDLSVNQAMYWPDATAAARVVHRRHRDARRLCGRRAGAHARSVRLV